MKKTSSLVIAGILFLGLSSTAYALPTISSEGNQTFTKNQALSVQLRNITITEDATTPLIKGGLIKITIPESIAIIFDDERTIEKLSVYGTAVNSGRVLAKPKISFENKDKTLVIPVQQDFATGEYIVITEVYAEGFNVQATNSVSLSLQVSGSAATYMDPQYLYIITDTKTDSYRPEIPSNIMVQNDPAGVKLTWTDPTDLDLQTVNILRGLNNLPIDGGNPILVGKGVQSYIDTKVTKGDTVKYILQASDGPNLSYISAEVDFVVGSTIAPPQPAPTPAPAPTPTPPPATQETIPPAPEPTPPPACKTYFRDVSATAPTCEAIQFLKLNKIISGYPDGTFGPDKEVNRVEMLKMALLMFNKTLQTRLNANYKDVSASAWYIRYISTATSMAIIAGYPDGTFRPQQSVSKVEAMKMIFLSSALQAEKSADDAPFKDTPAGSWYIPYVQYFKGHNLDLGDAEGNLHPDKKMTRGEIALYLYGFARL